MEIVIRITVDDDPHGMERINYRREALTFAHSMLVDIQANSDRINPVEMDVDLED